MNRMWPFALVGLVCLCVGVGLDEARHSLLKRRPDPKEKAKNTEELFQYRLRCKGAADDYVNANSDENSTLFLERVDFSPSRHSCIAAFTRWTTGRRKLRRCNCLIEIHNYEAVDLLSGETLSSGTCFENDPDSSLFCGNGRDLQLGEERSKALESALTSQE